MYVLSEQSRASSADSAMAPPMISASSCLEAFSSRKVQPKNAASALSPTTTLPWPRICTAILSPSARERSAACASLTTSRGLFQVGTPPCRNEPCRNTGTTS